jgi:Family of unknown function (DUF5686)/CarboxypepD_reg-like domain
MKKYTLLLFIFVFNVNFGQIKGQISDQSGKPLASVNVYLENTYNNTTANDNGKYSLNVSKTGEYVVVFKFIGFKTKKEKITIESFPYFLNISLNEENFELNEIVINKKINPALAIIKNAIASRKENGEKTSQFTADFYSRGMMKLKNLPKKLMGMEIDIDEETQSNLDSTGTGIIYLSETVSKIAFKKPSDFNEKIIASKTAGNNKGYSYNTAKSSNYDFYDNTVKIGVNLISPIANNAFGYYKYKFDNSFYDDNNLLINKIKVIPTRDKEPVFEGYIYIVDGSWAIYAIDLEIKGYRMKNEFLENMFLKQNFSYNANNKIWAKNAQSLEFTFGGFGIKYTGKFNYVFSNYDFKSSFDKNTFGNEVVSFEANSNKKTNDYWATNRPIPLTDEETDNYLKKEKLQIKRDSKQYKDSIDAKKNKFSFTDLLMGYSYKNSFKRYSLAYKGLISINALQFNTVQGYVLPTGFEYKNWNDEETKSTTIKTDLVYGFSEKRLRVSGEYKRNFNSINYAELIVSGGTKVAQFNNSPPITQIVNSVASLFFKNNFMKLYNLEFAEIKYGQDVANGVFMASKLAYLQRKPLFNTTNLAYFKKDDLYLSNNPTNDFDFVNAGFDAHKLLKFNLDFTFRFGNKYMSRPDEKINIRNSKHPILYFGYEKAFAASDKNFNFDLINARISYDLGLANFGKVGMNGKAGKFFNAQNISFIDYQHFNGNQTHVGQGSRYLNVFNFMPYYANSTNDSYFEWHSEYDDNGFVMNKLPLLSSLKSNLILGFHNLAIPNRKPYSEITVGLNNLGFGKLKIFRVDYIKSFQDGIQNDGVVFGCKILGAFE